MNFGLLQFHRPRGAIVVLWLSALLLATTGSLALGATFVVNADHDSHDTSPGDGQVDDGSSPGAAIVTLRAAIEEANALAGSDTILITSATPFVRPTLGSLVLEDNATALMGDFSLPIIDGVNLPPNCPLLEVAADSCVLTGLTVRRSRGHAVLVTGSANQVGLPDEGNVFVENGLDGDAFAAIAIVGTAATANQVAANLVGLRADGSTPDGNRIGVLIQGAVSNTIGGPSEDYRNIIAANTVAGVILTHGASHNTVAINYIGPDVNGLVCPHGQMLGIALLEGAHDNVIGADSLHMGNLISGNDSTAVLLSGPDVCANRLTANLIGVNRIGWMALANGGPGVFIREGAHHNQVGDSTAWGGNIISGNFGSGVHLTGPATEGNCLIGNVIGPDIRGYRALGNGLQQGDGVLIDDGSSDNVIGGATPGARNIISANPRYGIHISGPGCARNAIEGNYIGLTGSGTSTMSNAAGVVIDSGAHHNTIGGQFGLGGNVISGNRADLFPDGGGVIIRDPGTSFNEVIGNMIGLDATGARVIANGSGGVIIGDGASDNTVGGNSTALRNVISGNGYGEFYPGRGGGVHLHGVGTRHNRILGNSIGYSLNGLSILGNLGHGIGIFAGASDNTIGGNTPADGNTIVGSEWHGVFIDGASTIRNSLRHNLIYDNDSAAIVLSNGAQENVPVPVIVAATLVSVVGIGAPPAGTVDIYVAAPDGFGSGEGVKLVGSGTADDNGSFSMFLSGVDEGDTLTALATDLEGNTSSFAANKPTEILSPVDDHSATLPTTFALSQNYPNPFNPSTTIEYALPHSSQVRLDVFNLLGQTIATLVSEHQSPGRHKVEWMGVTSDGGRAASGVYIYRLLTEASSATRRMLLLK